MSLKRTISAALVAVCLIMSVLSLSSCYKEELVAYSCGSGFYINRDDRYDYHIDELGVSSSGNYFYLEDYFYSEEHGRKYKISDGLFTMGYVYLAKKSDYYDDTVYDFDLDTLDEPYITITPEMDYVYIHSDQGDEKELFIEVESRDLPLDITLENVNIYTKSAVPVFFSQSYLDINIKLVESNSFSAGSLEERSQSIADRLENGLSKIEDKFLKAYDGALTVVQEIPEYISEQSITNILSDSLFGLGRLSANLFTYIANGYFDVLTGKEGAEGITGVTCFVHLGGVSFSGEGSITIEGGKGGRGSDATDSLMGGADGGDGGRGGCAISCRRLLAVAERNLKAVGGKGGNGGDPSDGLFGIAGSSGSAGSVGAPGKATEIADPRAEYEG